MYHYPAVRIWKILLLLFALVISASPVAHSASEKRALVVGVSRYEALQKLPSAVNDARLIGSVLEKLGFDVTTVLDPDYDAMQIALQDFRRRLDGAQVALFYYSGHGSYVAGHDYLLPTDTPYLGGVVDISRKAVDVHSVFNAISDPGRTNLIFLDCGFLRVDADGQASEEKIPTRGSNTLIAYAAAPWKASEGKDGHGVFTSALARHLTDPQTEVIQMLIRTIADVNVATDHRQKPQVRAWLDKPFYFVPQPISPAGSRVALVVGNSAYQHMPVLVNPGADARAIADVLRGDGFEVEEEEDLPLRSLRDTFRRFGERTRGATIALVYFAGHGMQIAQRDVTEDYLLPVDADLGDLDDVEYQAVPLTRLLTLLQDAQMRIVLLDACRDNPIVARLSGQGTRGLTRSGLAPVPEATARGSLIGFAAAPGQKAKDGGRNSPYATALLKVLGTPGVEVDLMLRRAETEVEKATDGQQTPEHWNRLRGSEGVFLAGPQ